MPHIAIIEKATSTIANVYEDAMPNQGKFGGPWGWPEVTIHVAIPEDMDRDVIAAKLGEDGVFGFEVDATKLAQKQERLWAAMRAERNRLLADCDWTQTLDAPLSDEAKTAWREYRVALRDVPGGVVDVGAVEWPVKP